MHAETKHPTWHNSLPAVVAAGSSIEDVLLEALRQANFTSPLGSSGWLQRPVFVQSFEAVGSANAAVRSALLASGISTAMNATMLGLAVAIPCMIAYSYLINRTNRMSAELNRSAVRVLDVLKQRYFGATASAAAEKAALAQAAHAVAAQPGRQIPAFSGPGKTELVAGNV